MKNFLQPAKSFEITGLPHFFSKFFWQLYFKNISFLPKTKRCLLCWHLWIQNYQMTGKYLTSNTTFSKKVHIYRHIYWWGPGIYYSCILLVHPIRPWNLLNVKDNITWLKLYLVIIYAVQLKVNKQKNHLSFSIKNVWFFSNLLCSISSSHFRPFNFMCAFNR